jgi:Spy/CpxP family protein refolding chaperone
MSKCIKIIFTLSLLLNLVLAGMVGGGAWKHWHHEMPFGEASEQTRALFKQSFDNNRAAMKADIDALRAVRPALEKIVAAEKFDRAAYDAEVKKVLDVRNKMGQRRAAIMGDILAQLPQAERESVGKRMLMKMTQDRPQGHSPHGRDGRKRQPVDAPEDAAD